jgi:hypothetical protein
MSLPAKKEQPKGPRPDPVRQRLGEDPDIMKFSLAELAGGICERTGAATSWPDVQVLAMGWAASAREAASLLRQKVIETQEYAITWCEGNHDKANFEIVQSGKFRRLDSRISILTSEMKGYEKSLKELAKALGG